MILKGDTPTTKKNVTKTELIANYNVDEKLLTGYLDKQLITRERYVRHLVVIVGDNFSRFNNESYLNLIIMNLNNGQPLNTFSFLECDLIYTKCETMFNSDLYNRRI